VVMNVEEEVGGRGRRIGESSGARAGCESLIDLVKDWAQSAVVISSSLKAKKEATDIGE
jgi:hypothetical protein